MSFPTPLRAVITGAGSGLGRAMALDLAGRGASVLVSDIVLSSAEETAELVREKGGRSEGVRCDVTDRDEVFALVDEAEMRLGGIDLIANNAGVAVGGPFEEISIEDWRWAVDINLWGVVYGCQAAIPKMRAQGHGYIVNVASAAGVIRWMERSKVQAPGVAKAAMDSVRDGKLYVQPMREGRMAWRLKRTAPQRFYDSMSRAHKQFLQNRNKR
jgi:NAD(P)-dependent dehydrogenase (short-subunit alcohol dehydrogenase family)